MMRKKLILSIGAILLIIGMIAPSLSATTRTDIEKSPIITLKTSNCQVFWNKYHETLKELNNLNPFDKKYKDDYESFLRDQDILLEKMDYYYDLWIDCYFNH